MCDLQAKPRLFSLANGSSHSCFILMLGRRMGVRLNKAPVPRLQGHLCTAGPVDWPVLSLGPYKPGKIVIRPLQGPHPSFIPSLQLQLMLQGPPLRGSDIRHNSKGQADTLEVNRKNNAKGLLGPSMLPHRPQHPLLAPGVGILLPCLEGHPIKKLQLGPSVL